MLHFLIMESETHLKNELEKAKAELSILYEISNAMRTTLKLDEILYIILTGVTAHAGLGFNRAFLFLVNEKDGLIEGKMAIGPESGEEANRVWTQIDQQKPDLEDLINVYKSSKPEKSPLFSIDDDADLDTSGLSRKIKHLKIPIQEEKGGLLAMEALDGLPLHLNKESINKYRNDPLLNILKPHELIVVPLKAKDKVNGIIVADNFITKKPINKDNIRMLIMLANQAGLAIENSQLYEQTVLRAHSDSLTGLWNHGYFQFLLQQEIETAQAARTPLSLIMMDIDDFKIYNDKLGHQAGDKILKELAALLKKQSRKMDLVCRYGGEEFTIILPQTEHSEAFLIAERLREHVLSNDFIHEEILPNKQLTVSIGLASYPHDGKTPADLIKHCDRALYQAKHRGKNNTYG